MPESAGSPSAPAASGGSVTLSALEQRLELLRASVAAGELSHVAADDEGTQILETADGLDLDTDGKARRRRLIQRIDALLDGMAREPATPQRQPASQAAESAAARGEAPPPKRLRLDAGIDAVLVAGRRLLAEVSWLRSVARGAVACGEESYLHAVVRKDAHGRFEVLKLVDRLEGWARGPHLATHQAECAKLADELAREKQNHLEVDELLKDPAHAEPFSTQSRAVYEKLSKIMDETEADGRSEWSAADTAKATQASPGLHRMLARLITERREVKMDIAAIEHRFAALQKRHRHLTLVSPAKADLTGMSIKDLLLVLQLHGLSPPKLIPEKVDLVQHVLDAGICSV